MFIKKEKLIKHVKSRKKICFGNILKNGKN